jgi:hypothetical protein
MPEARNPIATPQAAGDRHPYPAFLTYFSEQGFDPFRVTAMFVALQSG